MAPGKVYLLNSLTEKMQSPDSDFRYMALNDLANEIAQDQAIFGSDETIEAKVLNQVLKLVEDKISEVKNQAVKCLGQLIKIVRENQMNIIVDKLIEYSGGKDEELRDIAGLALKTVTTELPQDAKITQKACAKLTPKLLLQLKNPSTPPETAIDTLSILSILATRFAPYLADLDQPPLDILSPLLNHPRPAVRKRVILTLAQFLPPSSPRAVTTLLKSLPPLLAASATLDQQRTTVQLLGAIARYAPNKLESTLNEIVPGIINAAGRGDAELSEGALQALETIVLKCPTEVTPFVAPIITVGSELIKYDPNYAGDDDDDEEMNDADEDEDEELQDEYSDDEDTSYKVRRSATKLLSAVISTRPALLVTFLRSVSPVLISRFGDREESVRLEVWSTYGVLLKQIEVYGGSPQTREASGLKRKREDSNVESRSPSSTDEETPYSLLRGQAPTFVKTLLKQLQAKIPPPALQAGISLLHSFLTVLPGSMAASSSTVLSIVSSVLAQPTTTTTSTLHTTTLTFVARFFSTHQPATFTASLPNLLPRLLTSAGDKHPRIASESFRVFSALLNALKPIGVSTGAGWVESVYDEVVRRLERTDTDADVRARAEECLADLWLCATDVVRRLSGKEWEALMKGARTEGAVQVIERVAKEVVISDKWVGECIEWVCGVLRKSGRGGRVDAFKCLEVLLRGYKAGVPHSDAEHIIPHITPYITTSDLSLLAHSLSVLTVLLQLSPKETFEIVERDLLSNIYILACSPLVSGAALDALLSFFYHLVQADGQITTHVIPGLRLTLENTKAGQVSPANVGKCIGAVVRSQNSIAAGAIAEFSKYIQPSSKASEAKTVLSLLTLGEIGRFIDMSPQADIFTNSLEFFLADSEELRSAAAFAVGNIAIGNIHQFLPVIIQQVQSNDEKRLLSLHALKEVVTHCSHGQLEGVAGALWSPLFENSNNSEESTRNVAAACLGKLTTTNPSAYLPQLQARLRDPSPAIRATVVSAIRYTLADTTQSYDDLLSPLIIEFLTLVQDTDLTVKRLALSSLNAAARNKPHLIRDHLVTIMPLLYAETAVRPDLIRIVEMGPWKHKVDDGLEARKSAYETMYTILDTCISKVDLHEFFTHVLRGLSDSADEIKVLCHMMLFRLSQVAPTTVSQRLDDASPDLEESVKGAAVTKDTVKQDLERGAELQRSALRAVAALSKISSPAVSPRFDNFVIQVEKGALGAEFRELL
ncbi:hypothetical protein BOTBODRAFT_172104 [Botryobasidium botryosum FD-172 SS1]|uniref:TATA-binding protein interacting (TIP20) domain-containing protein n=1 Tax=Botryobasidium botryosum (strain FD-172 SS1) TaxID=930990 RepID=A0A067MSI1_BOTB1|nr:hypothetical protein BOTBODRAFT_172104 [Botryobasidium botryosum FD-172 SS1]